MQLCVSKYTVSPIIPLPSILVGNLVNPGLYPSWNVLSVLSMLLNVALSWWTPCDFSQVCYQRCNRHRPDEVSDLSLSDRQSRERKDRSSVGSSPPPLLHFLVFLRSRGRRETGRRRTRWCDDRAELRAGGGKVVRRRIVPTPPTFPLHGSVHPFLVPGGRLHVCSGHSAHHSEDNRRQGGDLEPGRDL